MSQVIATSEYQSITLSFDEVLQCTDGVVELYTSGVPTATDRGLQLDQWESARYAATQVVYYRIGNKRHTAHGKFTRNPVSA